jgi:predicted nucleotidyltransferase
MAKSSSARRSDERIVPVPRVSRIAGSLEGVDVSRVASICERYGVVELSLFGSQARGDAAATSDVDLLYTLAPGRHLGFAVNRLEDELAEAFGRPVDLVSRTALHRLLRDEVLAESQVLYAA